MAREGLSRGDRLVLVAILASAGAVIAAYLTYEWYVAFTSPFCDVTSYFSCSTVGKSAFAAIGGVPTATIGLAGFLILLGLSVAALRGVERIGPWSPNTWILLFAIVGSLIGFGLTLVEIFIIGAVCILCGAGFALDLGILATAWTLRRGT